MNKALVRDIFKVPLYEFKLDLDNDKLYNFCLNYEQHNSGRSVSNQGGYQSQDLDNSNSILQPLIKQIKLHADTFSDQIINGLEQTVDNVWFNINRHKDFNINHNHPNAEISGAYYVRTPKDCGQIGFIHPGHDVLCYYNSKRGIKSSEMGPYDSESWNMPVNEGTLYLFPSWLNHHVTSNLSKTEDRVSFSFNTFYKGE